MKLASTRALLTAGALAAAALGFAGGAHAEPPLLNGTYTGSGGADEFLWTISSSCAPAACTATVSSNQGWVSPATFYGGSWHFVVTKPDGAICEDGRYAPAFISIDVDPVTLAGAVSSDSNYGCPGGHIDRTPFQLTKVG
ncbi:hypothetical protein [[Mycobacterium] wendilense]|uniref:Secreted protein n=1 Tax=[Mycobacterium] wendilense TaxID=3064284 RepID=A0ABM9MIN4_9MYCO|nr:hypothetical protein [Mycolicibacterium sp. MU0050]CAJ1586127.1 hypothetical protein MU0050_004100 [Mycolicibacterium sp. MU0050]